MQVVKQNEFSKGLSEIDYILKHTDRELLQRIPQSFWDFIEENKDIEYEVTININQPLEEQNLMEDTKNLMAFIYRNYICDGNEKQEYNELLNQNQRRYDEELSQKYSYDNIFKTNTKEEEIVIEDNQMIEYQEESIFTKIMNKIKNFFSKLKIQ